MRREWLQYVDDIRGAIDRVRRYTAGMDYAGFTQDEKTVDAVVRNIEIIGEAAKSLPDEIKAGAAGVDWRKVAAMRNLLAHAYFGVSLPLVWDVVQNKLDTLDRVCRGLAGRA